MKEHTFPTPYRALDPSRIPPRFAEPTWNDWRCNGRHELCYPAYRGGGMYSIDLAQLTSSTAVLNMVAQVAGKSWAPDRCLAGLVRALCQNGFVRR